MSLGSHSLGSVAFGGVSGAAAPIVITPAAQTLALSLQAPTIVTADGTTVIPATQTLTLSVQAPTVLLTPVVSATLDLGLSAQAPLILIVHQVAAPVSLALTVGGVLIPTPEIRPLPGTLSLSLTSLAVLIPTILITKQMRLPLDLLLTGGNMLNPKKGYLHVTIVRYISDPIKTGGCAQCGTFLYESVRGRYVRGEVVKRGRNFDEDKGRREDQYVKCGRCGWINHLNRGLPHLQPDGSRAGWGLNYTEIEAGESDISYP